MNIALGALIILLLLLPALFFRLGIFAVRATPLSSFTIADNFSREQVRRNFILMLGKLNFSETLFFFSIVPLVQHLISLVILHLCGATIDYNQLLKLFSSTVGTVGKTTPFGHELGYFLLYNLVETIIGFVLGWITTRIIMSNPDILRALAGDVIWFKLFTGLLLSEDTRKKVTVILVDILCETKETTIIYSGFLEKFDVTESKQLDYITLTAATRRDLREGAQVAEGPNTVLGAGNTLKVNSILPENGAIVPISGKFLTIPGSKILNVNVTYLTYGNKPNPNDPTRIIQGWIRLGENANP